MTTDLENNSSVAAGDSTVKDLAFFYSLNTFYADVLEAIGQFIFTNRSIPSIRRLIVTSSQLRAHLKAVEAMAKSLLPPDDALREPDHLADR